MRLWASEWTYTFNSQHGFGILFDHAGGEVYQKCFYEDGSLASGKGEEDFSAPIEELKRCIHGRWNSASSKAKRDTCEALISKAELSFSCAEYSTLYIHIKTGEEEFTVEVSKPAGKWYYDTKCSCKKWSCMHEKAAAMLTERRLNALQHAYVVSELAVDKSLFVDPKLISGIRNLEVKALDPSTVEEIRELIRMADSAKSGAYYRMLHRFLLNLEPDYDYDARFLEERYPFLLLALFENPGYREAVLDPGGYADPESYEERQHRSNRACLKRVLKEYQHAARALDEKGNMEEHPYKEFLLKYRENLPGLLRYYAEGKEMPEPADLPWLNQISGLPELSPEYIGAVAEKLDTMEQTEEAAAVLRTLTEKISAEQRVEIYSRLHHLSMPAEEIRGLGREDQLKMIRNTPLTQESFCYIMDDLLEQSDDAARGRFILYAAEQARKTGSMGLKQAIAARAEKLPDHRLLLSYVQYKLNVSGRYAMPEGDPEKETGTYFRCDYEISTDNQKVTAAFTVSDPETGSVLLYAMEEGGRLGQRETFLHHLGYTPETIRKVCLRGKEEKYREDIEKNREEQAAALFEKDHRKFALEYRRLCETLSEEKILYTEAGKIGIDWLIFREGGSNALAFKVGRSRMYVVKDAAEFVSSFRKGVTAEYGRDLILTHDTANLNDADAAVMKRLMTAKLAKGRRSEPGNKRYITVSDALLENILETLAGRTVLFNEAPCLIRLEPRKMRLKINGDYTLSTDLNSGSQAFFSLVGRGYLLTRRGEKEGAALDRVEGSPEEISLMNLVHQNPSVSIRPILKDFRKNIYSRFFELFDVDKAVQQQFVMSRLRLNTYFDFEKGVITARTVLLRDEREIGPEALDRMDRARVELLETYLQALGFADGILSEESRVLAFFKMDFTRLKTLTNVYLSEQLKNKELKSIGRPVIRVAYQNNLVRVFLEKSEFTDAELEQIIAGLRKKRKYILLDRDRIVDLDSDAARDFGEAVKDFGMDPKDLYRKKTVSIVNAIKAFSHERSCRVDKFLRDMIEEIRSFKEAEIPLPPLKAELRDYQAEGFRWLSILAKYGMGGILADDMGLGKTLQIIALLKSDRSRKPSLVVCPKSLVFNWMSEFTRFDGSTRVTAVYGTDAGRGGLISAINEKEKAVYITSYDSLRNDISRYTAEFNYVILDEAQYIKNVNALKTRSVKELKARHRFALTGTPIENSVVDLWSIFDFIMPGYFEELSGFRDTDPDVIARKAAPFILRRVKEDVLEDLPAKYERILSADMSEEQRRLYDAMRQEARKALETGGRAFDLLPYLTRLRQICVDPGMFVENYQGGSGKMDMLSSLIPEYLEAHHRILIFSQFVKALESVERMLKEKGIPASFLSGATSAKDRIKMMDDFNNGSGTDVFLISLKAGGTGLNLTGADTVIHLDPWWNVAAENQASDRTHRIGQTRNVEVIRLIAGESIEQRVVELQDLKKEVIRRIISDDDGSVTGASLEDIAFVLE